MLANRAKQLRLGPGLNEKTDVGPVINRDASEKILEYVEIGRREDKAKLLCGGRRAEKGDLKYGFFIRADGILGCRTAYANRSGRDLWSGSVRARMPRS